MAANGSPASRSPQLRSRVMLYLRDKFQRLRHEMPRACALCTYPDPKAVDAALASGASDRKLAKQFGLSHMAVYRHRREHVVKPLQLAATALDKGRTVRERREELIEKMAKGDPTAIF